MDIIEKIITKQLLIERVSEFIKILESEKFEYWNAENFLKDLYGKYEISVCFLINDKLIAYIIASQKDDTAHIHKFMVSYDYRNFGIGAKLQIFFENNLKIKGLKKLSLWVVSENYRAQNFYYKLGYNIKDNRLDTRNNIELKLMTKELL